MTESPEDCIDRVARAIAESLCKPEKRPFSWEPIGEGCKEKYRDAARAAIRAMGETPCQAK